MKHPEFGVISTTTSSLGHSLDRTLEDSSVWILVWRWTTMLLRTEWLKLLFALTMAMLTGQILQNGSLAPTFIIVIIVI